MILNKSLTFALLLTGGGICLNNSANAVTLYSCKPCTARDPNATNCNPKTGRSTSCKQGYHLNYFGYCTRNTINCNPGYGGCSYMSGCFKCPSGTYSPGGCSACSPCPNGTYQPNSGGCSCLSCSEMRVYYGYATKYTNKRTPELKWNTVYTCGNTLFGDPRKGHSKYCTADTHKKGLQWYMDSGIGIGEGSKFQIICEKTTGNKCIYDENGTMKKCLKPNYKW
ncbi:MAG: hypothetical protein ACI4N3_02365 [Alphaproteobacteria bacterium]